MREKQPQVTVRNTRPEDFPAVVGLSRAVYPHSLPWREELLASHLEVFPEGQFVAVASHREETAAERDKGAAERAETTGERGKVMGMAASLLVAWDDYEFDESWVDFTDAGTFGNHDPEGRTLYGAEVMVHPNWQGRGVGTKLYNARRELVRRLGLRRIRAHARLRGYHRHAEEMTPQEYTAKVVRGELADPTLTFQIRRGFRVLAVVSSYLRRDPESLGYAALIEWINEEVTGPEEYAGREGRFAPEFTRAPNSGGRPPGTDATG